MSQTVYAQDAPYWGTSVDEAKSQYAVMALLEKWGASSVGLRRSATGEGEIYFEFEDRTYRLTRRPLPIRERGFYRQDPNPDRSLIIKARMQAWRALVYHLKAILEGVLWEGMAVTFLPYLVLPSGQVLHEVPPEALVQNVLPRPSESATDTEFTASDV